jgi:hypothetical protein
LVQAFLKKWWVESDFKAPNLPLSLRKPQENMQSMFIKITNKTMASEDVNMKYEILQTNILECQQ